LTTTVTCASCGAPLSPEQAVRVRCEFCGAVNDVAAPQVVAVAQKLNRLGIRVPDRIMSVEDIEADLASRQAAEREKRRTALIVCAVLVVVFGLVLAAAMVAQP
jgi:LSD1 subclass zinc finger protein